MKNSFDATQWRQSDYAKQYFAVEKPLLDRALQQLTGPKVLQLGLLVDDSELIAKEYPTLIRVFDQLESVTTTNSECHDVIAARAFLPFAENTFSSVVLPHALQGHVLPHQVLREAYRVLQPEGYLLLTGMNPYSLMGLQRYISKSSVPNGQYYSPSRVKDWMKLLGFDVVGSSMFHYSPLLKGGSLGFLNSIGDRWLPMLGGGYMITARKREHRMTLVGGLKFARKKRKQLIATPTRKAAPNHQKQP